MSKSRIVEVGYQGYESAQDCSYMAANAMISEFAPHSSSAAALPLLGGDEPRVLEYGGNERGAGHADRGLESPRFAPEPAVKGGAHGFVQSGSIPRKKVWFREWQITVGQAD